MSRAPAHPAAEKTSGSGERETPGGELLISVGGVVGHLTWGAAPTLFIAQLRDRYGPYTVPPAPWVERAFSLRLDFLAAAPIVDGETRAGDVAARPLRIEESDQAIRLGRWDFTARLAPQVQRSARSRGGARPPVPSAWSGTATCQMNPFALDSLLRVLWAIFLPRAGGALFHACALRIGEVGVIFPGQSGAGKSTLAAKVPDPERVLTDELVAVSRGELGRWRISGTPFWGDFKRGGGSIRSWPLRALAFLEQSDRVETRPLPHSEAAMRLLGCFLCFQTDADTAARNLAIAVDLATDIDGLALRTARETPMAAVETALAPHLPDRNRRDQPPTAREMVSEFRWFLRQSRQYAYKPRGTSMRPWLRPGDALFIQAVGETEMVPGDILLYWTPGRTAHDDRLTCHRMVARMPAAGPAAGGQKFKFFMKGDALSAIEGFENGRQSEILGRVSAISRDGQTQPVPGRIGNLARLLGSLVAAPILRMVGR